MRPMINAMASRWRNQMPLQAKQSARRNEICPCCGEQFAPLGVGSRDDPRSYLRNTVVHSENGKFNAESNLMWTPRSMVADSDHFVVFLLRIIEAGFSMSISLSVALKRPVRSFGAITDSSASSFTLGSARV